MKILVTGGAGFIGSYIVDKLLSAGHEVRVLDNLEPQVHGRLRELQTPPEYLDPGAEFVFGDVRDYDTVRRCLQGMDVVYHEAALVGVGQSMYEITRYTDVNVMGTATLLQAIADAKERPHRLLVASSISIYGEGAYRCDRHGIVSPKTRSRQQLLSRQWELVCPVNDCGRTMAPVPTSEEKPVGPTSVYAINKRDQEEMVLAFGQAYGIPAFALRYFNTYGSRQALSNPYTGVAAVFASRLLNGNSPVIFEDGQQMRDFVHVEDIARANLLLLNADESLAGVYNVASGHPISILDLANTLGELMHHKDPPEIAEKFRAGDIRHCVADISKIEALGYRSKTEFRAGMSELVEWVRTQASPDHFDAARKELDAKGLTL